VQFRLEFSLAQLQVTVLDRWGKHSRRRAAMSSQHNASIDADAERLICRKDYKFATFDALPGAIRSPDQGSAYPGLYRAPQGWSFF